MFFINDIPLIIITDTGVTHFFICVDCVKRLNHVVSVMNGVWLLILQLMGR